MSGNKKYYYAFDVLHSDDKNILDPPTVTVKTKGKIPKKPKGKIIYYFICLLFVYINCMLLINISYQI